MRKLKGLLLIAWLLVGCTAVNVEPLAPAAEAEIYAQVVRQVVTVDDTFGGTLNPPVVYVVDHTDDSVGDPEETQADSRPLSVDLQADVTKALGDLSAEILWVNGREAVAFDEETGRAEDDGVLVTLGNVHMQNDTTAYVAASIYVANLAAGGQTYVLELVDGDWTITGTTGVQWIS